MLPEVSFAVFAKYRMPVSFHLLSLQVQQFSLLKLVSHLC